MKRILIFFVFIQGCSSTPRLNSKDLNDYKEEVKAKTGLLYDNIHLVSNLDAFIPSDHKNEVIGFCSGKYVLLNRRAIFGIKGKENELHKEFSLKYSSQEDIDARIVSVLLHEIGHCAFNFTHEDGDYIFIMQRNVPYHKINNSNIKKIIKNFNEFTQ